MVEKRKTDTQRFAEVQGYAKERGGVCVSAAYKNTTEALLFKCGNKEHKPFLKSYNKLFSTKTWCPDCNKPQVDIEKLLGYVKEKGGSISTPPHVIRTNNDLVSLACKLGHSWKVKIGRLLATQCWCPECGKACGKNRLTIERIQAAAMKFGGRCLTSTFKSARVKMRFECGKGHAWESTPFAVVYNGNWCNECAKVTRNLLSPEAIEQGLARLNSIALTNNGKCLSQTYEGLAGRYLFECELSHIWKADANNVVHNRSWCPECAGGMGEKLAVLCLEKATAEKFEKRRPKWLLGLRGRPLELDAFNEKMALGLEYQGVQHYNFVKGWHKTEECFKEAQARDELKRKLCAAHEVYLFEVPFLENLTKDGMKLHMENLAAKACLPFDINPDYRAFRAEMDAIAESHRAAGHPEQADEACRLRAMELAAGARR